MEKILVIHNKYRNIGGEDIAVSSEIEFLKKYYKIETLYFENYISNLFFDLLSFIFNSNLKSKRILKTSLEKFNPDYVYVHNTWFKASLSIFKLLEKRKIPTIVKLHNFRYSCTNSYLIKNHTNDICLACGIPNLSKNYFNKYFQESYIKSFLVNRYGKKYYKILSKNNIKVIVLTEFHKKFLTNKIKTFNVPVVFRNYINFPQRSLSTRSHSFGKFLVYAGRISKEKGVEEVIQAFINQKQPGVTLKIIGDRPLLDYLKKAYNNQDIHFLGQISNDSVVNYIENALAVITATKLYEGQPTLLSEASSLGIPSIFPKTGGISEFFPENYSLSFEQFNYLDMENKIAMALDVNKSKKIGGENEKYITKLLDHNKLINDFRLILNEL